MFNALVTWKPGLNSFRRYITGRLLSLGVKRLELKGFLAVVKDIIPKGLGWVRWKTDGLLAYYSIWFCQNLETPSLKGWLVESIAYGAAFLWWQSLNSLSSILNISLLLLEGYCFPGSPAVRIFSVTSTPQKLSQRACLSFTYIAESSCFQSTETHLWCLICLVNAEGAGTSCYLGPKGKLYHKIRHHKI